MIAFSSAFVAGLGLLAVAAPSQASLPSPSPSPAPMVSLTASLAPPVPAGATRLGALAPDTNLSVEVTLNIPDQAALTAFLSGLSNPDSPDFQRFLGPGQFGPTFGPSLAQVAAVDRALKAAGLSPGQVSANRLAIPVTAPASVIERAFGITLESYRLPGGREAFANASAPRLSAAVAPLVQGVLGLDDVYPLQHLTSGPPTATPLVAKASGKVAGPVRAAATPGPKPCAAASSSGNTANTFAGYYGPVELYTLGDFGQGAKIAVLELEPNLASDISAYESCYGIHTRVNYTHIDGGAGSGAGSGEAALDIETVAGLAPKSQIDVYQAPNTGNGPGGGDYDIFKKFVTSDTDKVLSDSWGDCEARTVVANVKALESLFEQANAQGQTIFAAAGDSGSTGCYNADGSDVLSALSPASAPYVIGVGGTSFSNSSSNQQEIVWNDSDIDSGAGGGGVSSIWCMPNYQHQTSIPGIVNAHSRKDTSSSCKSKYYREVPDISADGDPAFGYAIYWDGSWEDIGGTSAATPLWASVAALTNVSPFCAAYGSKGATLPQNLYNAVAAHHAYIYGAPLHVLRDVTSGNNDYTVSGYTGGLYSATKGYDMASGLGTPVVTGQSRNQWSLYLAGLASVLCHQAATKLKTVKVTSVGPNHGPAGKKTKVTVHGAGFLPIGAADEAQIVSGSKVLATVAASCTTTACTLTLPAESARTVDIRIFANSLWGSGVSKADRFTYRRT